ncbi:hypothetical protein BD770DRAFT_457917 [Pilaira anomala]|nr:hypothetical protein BD770DRAFT_457917 [Pilaira anomala]
MGEFKSRGYLSINECVDTTMALLLICGLMFSFDIAYCNIYKIHYNEIEQKLSGLDFFVNQKKSQVAPSSTTIQRLGFFINKEIYFISLSFILLHIRYTTQNHYMKLYSETSGVVIFYWKDVNIFFGSISSKAFYRRNNIHKIDLLRLKMTFA